MTAPNALRTHLSKSYAAGKTCSWQNERVGSFGPLEQAWSTPGMPPLCRNISPHGGDALTVLLFAPPPHFSLLAPRAQLFLRPAIEEQHIRPATVSLRLSHNRGI